MFKLMLSKNDELSEKSESFWVADVINIITASLIQYWVLRTGSFII